MMRATWKQRAARAQRLASIYPFAAEALDFYSELAGFCGQLRAHLESSGSGVPAGEPSGALLRSATLLPVDSLLSSFPPFLAALSHAGPTPLAEAASQLMVAGEPRWSALLGEFWTHGRGAIAGEAGPDHFFARAFLLPYAEFLAEQAPVSNRVQVIPTCPACGGAPQAGALRPEGDGGKRFLICSFCLTEWEFRRICCAACMEVEERKLPVYSAEQFDFLRIEACETCKHYIISSDLTKDGHAIAEVDELAALPLGLWATEHGFTKVQPNLLGM